MQLAEDPDLEVPRWLEEGTPVGIARPIKPSGLLPLIKEFATTTAEKLQSQAQWDFNHPSFDGVEDGKRGRVVQVVEAAAADGSLAQHGLGDEPSRTLVLVLVGVCGDDPAPWGYGRKPLLHAHYNAAT